MIEHSLWLLPDTEHQSSLLETIARLSVLMGGARFEPHVTIHGDVDLPLEALQQLARQLAEQTAVQTWPVEAVQPTTHFFRCLVLRFGASAAFDALQAALLRRPARRPANRRTRT